MQTLTAATGAVSCRAQASQVGNMQEVAAEPGQPRKFGGHHHIVTYSSQCGCDSKHKKAQYKLLFNAANLKHLNDINNHC